VNEEPFWRPDNQNHRLNELAGVPPEIKEEPLRRDIRSLGRLLGDVIKEQEGSTLFQTVETLRKLSIAHRAQNSGFEPAQEIVSRVSIEEAAKLSKAFGIYFELTNIAETNHRKRRRRASQLFPDAPPQLGTFEGTLVRLRDAGIGSSEVLAALRQLRIVPVFTAHPTEVSRRTVLWKRQRIAEHLESLDVLPLTDAKSRRIQEELASEITALWQTEEVRRKPPTVLDEIQMGLDYSHVLLETVPSLYEEIASSIGNVYDGAPQPSDLPRILEFGSWI
jgi:phosphoenolpyruvate carboxylase